MTWIYVKTEPTLWTVGFYDPKGRFNPETDHDSLEKAARRCAWLNGANVSDNQNKEKELSDE